MVSPLNQKYTGQNLKNQHQQQQHPHFRTGSFCNQFYWIIRTEPEAPLLCSSTGDEPVLAELALSSEEQRPAGPCRWLYRARHTSTWEQCCKIVMATHKGTSQFLHTALTWIFKNHFFQLESGPIFVSLRTAFCL